jgi:hypothetical protein
MSNAPKLRQLSLEARQPSLSVTSDADVEVAGTTYRAGGGNIVPPPPISLQEPGRFRVFLEDVSEVSEQQ